MSRLFLTSMCGPGNEDNIREMVEPIGAHLDGIVWVLNDCPLDDPGVRYLALRTGKGRVIHRFWPGRHHVAMNDTLFTGDIAEGDYVIWCDTLERPMLPFVARVKSEIGPMMQEADLDVIAAWGKAFLMRYRETMEYRGSPHWGLTGHNGRAIEWSTIEPDETKVRFNARPSRRQSETHWVTHYARYWVEYPAGSNHALLGLEKQGDPSVLFPLREARRLAFRREMVARGYPLTMEGLKTMLTAPLDEGLKAHLRAEKTLADVWHLWAGNGHLLKDTHLPSDALPIL